MANEENYDPLDFLDRQLLLFSDSLKETIKLYLPKLLYKKVLLVNVAQQLKEVYYLPIFDAVECLSTQCVMTPDKSVVKKLVLTEDAIRKYPLFQVKHKLETIIIARLDMAESIMRREFRGIKLQRVELE